MKRDAKPEILAPAGTLDALVAAFDAGADAVYVGGKTLNMRMHRASYNLTDGQVAEAVSLAHVRGKRLHVAMNSLVMESELPEVRAALERIGRIGPDALIVQDLAVASLAREACVHVPLHASTMMNVHSAETALALKFMGFRRIIASRDIPLHEVRRIGEAAGIETEYFVHGDMCIAHGSQCYLSALLFGQSSNRGRCMKPCRWKWTLVGPDGETAAGGLTTGHILARKDLCLFQHVPALFQNDIASLKIEGRMRTKEFLAPLISAYRQAVDAYFADPIHYAADVERMSELWMRRIRELTTSHAFTNPGASSVDASGSREPRFFSRPQAEAELSFSSGHEEQPAGHKPELIAHVATRAAAEAAAEAGANAIYVGGDEWVRFPTDIDAKWLTALAAQMKPRGVRVAYLGPRAGDERDLAEWRGWLRQIAGSPVGAGVSTLGALAAAQEMRVRDILADFSLNVANSVAADELSTMGATRLTASVELDMAELADLLAACRLPAEVIGQGPLPAMLMEHCIIAAATGHTPHGVCPMDCRRGPFVLRDEAGLAHRIECDRRCRNHLYMAMDVCVLPNLARLPAAGVSGIRIEAQFDEPPAVAVIVAAYRRAIDALAEGADFDAAEAVRAIAAATGRPLGDGPLAYPLAESRPKEDSDVIR